MQPISMKGILYNIFVPIIEMEIIFSLHRSAISSKIVQKTMHKNPALVEK
jgi:hypothetical protein